MHSNTVIWNAFHSYGRMHRYGYNELYPLLPSCLIRTLAVSDFLIFTPLSYLLEGDEDD